MNGALSHNEPKAHLARCRLFTGGLLMVGLYLAVLNCFAQPADASIQTTPTIALQGDGIEFASEVVDGVQARILISDVRADMKKLGSVKTHLMAVRFFDAATDTAIPQGHAALYLKSEHDKSGFFDPMKNQDGIFVSGLLLVKPGEKEAVIATKLLDRKSRDFHVAFRVE